MALTVSRANDFAADGGLDGYFEHLAGDEFLHLVDEGFASFVGEVAVDDDAECVDCFAGDEDVHFDHGRGPHAGEVVVRGRRSRGRRT